MCLEWEMLHIWICDMTHLATRKSALHIHMQYINSSIYRECCSTSRKMSHVTYSYIHVSWMSHLTHVSRVTQVNGPTQTSGCTTTVQNVTFCHVESHNESCRTCSWVTGESCHACQGSDSKKRLRDTEPEKWSAATSRQTRRVMSHMFLSQG